LKVGDGGIWLPLALHKEWSRHKFESPYGAICKNDLDFLMEMVIIYYKTGRVRSPPIGALAEGVKKILVIKGQLPSDTFKGWEIDTKGQGFYYSSATIAAVQRMLAIADNVGSEMGELKDSIRLLKQLGFHRTFPANFHTR